MIQSARHNIAAAVLLAGLASLVSCADGRAAEVDVPATVRIEGDSDPSSSTDESTDRNPGEASLDRGRSFMDTSPVAPTESSADGIAAGGRDADAATRAGGVSPMDSSQFTTGNTALTAGLSSQLAAGLREDPGQTADGTIDGLITFGDLTLLGVDVDELLDYIYKPDTERAKRFKFPDRVTEKAGEDKAVVGYMIALEFKPKTDQVTSFMLVRDLQACCFGGVPRPDEWIMVEMAEGKTTDYHMYVPVTVRGNFFPGRVPDEYGYAAAVYNMTAESVTRYNAPIKKRVTK